MFHRIGVFLYQRQDIKPLTVIKITIDDFILCDNLFQAIINVNVNIKKDKVDWLRMRWIRVREDDPVAFHYTLILSKNRRKLI